MNIAVLVPCYNEELTIGKVVADFRHELPEAKIYVYDNNSSDKTVAVATGAGAIVRHEYRQGKGFVVQKMFSEVEADVYIMIDGDDTYPAEAVHDLIKPVLTGRADMVVGDRGVQDNSGGGHYVHENKRRFHVFGNQLTNKMINLLFGAQLSDIMSGYRVFSRRFVKNIPLITGGFELETQMTLHALDKGFVIAELPTPYRDRPEGSVSKLNTFRDGYRVIKTIIMVFKDYKPFAFYGGVALLLFALSLFFGMFPIVEYVRYSVVHRFPLAILATGLAILGSLSLVCGSILHTLKRYNRELYALRLLDYKNTSPEQE